MMAVQSRRFLAQKRTKPLATSKRSNSHTTNPWPRRDQNEHLIRQVGGGYPPLRDPETFELGVSKLFTAPLLHYTHLIDDEQTHIVTHSYHRHHHHSSPQSTCALKPQHYKYILVIAKLVKLSCCYNTWPLPISAGYETMRTFPRSR